jgi:NDP-sugar pyrophosphorylase family protein
MKTKQAIIAIGGGGTRLYRKEVMPKSMIQINGHPIFY